MTLRVQFRISTLPIGSSGREELLKALATVMLSTILYRCCRDGKDCMPQRQLHLAIATKQYHYSVNCTFQHRLHLSTNYLVAVIQHTIIPCGCHDYVLHELALTNQAQIQSEVVMNQEQVTTNDHFRYGHAIQIVFLLLWASEQNAILGAPVAVVGSSLNKPNHIPGLAFTAQVQNKPCTKLCSQFLARISAQRILNRFERHLKY